MEASNPDKVIFPDQALPEQALTKADLVGYYNRVADKMLPMVENRPLTLHRFPNGIGAKGFMQKNVAKHFPASIGRYEVPRQDGGSTVYPVVRQAEHIAWLANQGTIAFHIWTRQIEPPTHPDPNTGESDDITSIGPDWMVIDLDPAAKAASGADVHSVAAATRAVLDEFGINSHPVATGSKGFHLWIALDQIHDHVQVAVANRALAGLVAVRNPDIATTEFLKKDRKGRVFVDWLRANRGATVVAPLSLRAKSGAPVAAPLDWDEVAGTAPNQWTMADVDRLLERPTLTERVTTRQSIPVDDIVAEARSVGVDLDTPFDRFGRKR